MVNGTGNGVDFLELYWKAVGQDVLKFNVANLIKIVFWDGTGLCLFTKRLEEGRFSIGPDEHLVEVSKFMYRCSRNLELGAPVFDIRMHIDQDGLAAGVETLCLL